MEPMTCYVESSWCTDTKCPAEAGGQGKIKQYYVSCIGNVGTTCSC